MKLSAKVEYATLAVLDLAVQYGSGEPVRIGAIAARHGIPQRFLVQILLQLKGAGLVASSRGAAGGYRLTRPPEEITLADVLGVIEGPQHAEPTSSAAADSAAAAVLLDVWRQIAEVQQNLLAETTFADLAEHLGQKSENMYYI